MDLPEEKLREFARLWKIEFDEDLSPADTCRYAALLLELYVVLYGPDANESKPHDGPHGPPT